MAKKHGLGKGLDALIPAGEGTASAGGGVLQLPVERIKPNPRQPRHSVGPEDLKDLTESIRAHGVLQPLLVTFNGSDYLLIAGQRRLQAARLAGLEFVPAIVRQASEIQQLELALIENLQREDLNPLEAAEGYQRLCDEFSLSHEAIAEQVGKSRAAVTNTLRLLKLAPAARQALTANRISEGHARALLGLPTAQAQGAALQTVLKRDLNVRQTEELVRRLNGQRRTSGKATRRSAEETALEDQLRQSLGTRVLLRRGARGGSIILHFYSDEELNALVERLLR
jgi:ParB family transcriptional regulator, chromosome partitioning protein